MIDREKVDEAIYALAWSESEFEPLNAHDDAHTLADAAIAAVLEQLREPSEAMVDAAINANLDIYWSYRADGEPGGPADVWRVMLDAAMKEAE